MTRNSEFVPATVELFRSLYNARKRFGPLVEGRTDLNLNIPCVAGLLLTTLIAQVPAKQDSPAKKTPAPNAGIVTGRVFAITQGGDLPARMAHVYLFLEKGPEAASLTKTIGTTPDLFYLQKKLEAIKEAIAAGSCRSDLIATDKAILATLAWATENHLTDFVPFGDADEEGNFTITKVKPGVYDVIARGQAGSNDSSWSQDITLKPGGKVTIKLSNVESSCSNVK